MLRLLIGGMVIGAALGLCRPASAQSDDHCKVPNTLTQTQYDLSRTAGVLKKPGATLTIVALGSSSTEGVGASAPRFTYPSQLQQDLSEHLRRPVVVLNKGIGGEVASQMLVRLDRDVFANHPDLVIWQAGTNDYLAHVPAEEMAAVLKAGIEELRAAGIDVLLLEPQYLPKDNGNAYHTYLDTFRQVAATEKVSNFLRFDIMRYWLTSHEFEASEMMSPDSLHMRDSSYICIASLLSQTIESGADPAATRMAAKDDPVH